MPNLVFWIDVDNTLIDNDRIKKNLDTALRTEIGETLAELFWEIYEQVRHEKNLVDVPLSLQRLREQTTLADIDEQTFKHVQSIFKHFPFQQALFPQTLETLEHLRGIGTPVIVSDGDPMFQAEKIVNSALAEIVEGHVLLYTHKQEHLPEMMHAYPADHYVMIDDKPSILADIKRCLEDKVTTVFVKQGKYAHTTLSDEFLPDRVVKRISDLGRYTGRDFLL
jgi:FMN phosphatase YigB (HAD superfamily)